MGFFKEEGVPWYRAWEMSGLRGSSCHSLPSQAKWEAGWAESRVNSELVEAVKTRYEKVIEDNENEID